MDRSFALRLPKPLPIAPSRRVLRTGAAVLAALALLSAGWLWLRDSPLLAVKHVQITGVHGKEAAAIESALTAAARGMSTTHLNVAALRSAVAPYRLVRDLSVSAKLPHGLRIHVLEQPPVAALSIGATRTAVAADGVVLGPGFLSSRLPVIHGTLPAGDGQSVSSARVLDELAVLGAAPETLLGWIARVYTGHNGLTVAMRNGLLLFFGDATRPHAKWLSAARVLSDSTAAGALYVDVRLPERPAAGMGGTSESSATGESSGTGQVSASDPTAAALAASLAGAVKNGPMPTITSSPTSGSGTTAPGSTTPGAATSGASTPATAPSAGTTGENP